MKLSDVAPYFEEGPMTREPGHGLTVTVTVKLDTPRKVVAFAWDMAREGTFVSWWHRPAVFFGVLYWGIGQLFTRNSP